MTRRERYEINQRLAAIEARLEAIDGPKFGPPRAAPLDMFDHEEAVRLMREGRIYRGRVY